MTEEKLRYFGSWKGRIIKAIAIDGARTWEEIRESTGLYRTTLNEVMSELFDAKVLRKLTKEGFPVLNLWYSTIAQCLLKHNIRIG